MNINPPLSNQVNSPKIDRSTAISANAASQFADAMATAPHKASANDNPPYLLALRTLLGQRGFALNAEQEKGVAPFLTLFSMPDQALLNTVENALADPAARLGASGIAVRADAGSGLADAGINALAVDQAPDGSRGSTLYLPEDIARQIDGSLSIGDPSTSKARIADLLREEIAEFAFKEATGKRDSRGDFGSSLVALLKGEKPSGSALRSDTQSVEVMTAEGSKTVVGEAQVVSPRLSAPLLVAAQPVSTTIEIGPFADAELFSRNLDRKSNKGLKREAFSKNPLPPEIVKTFYEQLAAESQTKADNMFLIAADWEITGGSNKKIRVYGTRLLFSEPVYSLKQGPTDKDGKIKLGEVIAISQQVLTGIARSLDDYNDQGFYGAGNRVDMKSRTTRAEFISDVGEPPIVYIESEFAEGTALAGKEQRSGLYAGAYADPDDKERKYNAIRAAYISDAIETQFNQSGVVKQDSDGRPIPVRDEL